MSLMQQTAEGVGRTVGQRGLRGENRGIKRVLAEWGSHTQGAEGAVVTKTSQKEKKSRHLALLVPRMSRPHIRAHQLATTLYKCV